MSAGLAQARAMTCAEGHARPGRSSLALACLGGFVLLPGKALPILPVGTAYVVRPGSARRHACSASAWSSLGHHAGPGAGVTYPAPA